MEKTSLYDITEGIKRVEEFVEDPQALTEYLDSLEMQLETKVSNIVRYSRTLELTADAVSNEIDRLIALKKYYELRSQNLKNYLAYSLQKIGKDNLETDIAKLSFRKSESVEILDLSQLDKEYITIKTTESADKTAIKKAIKDGKEVKGAEIITKLNLQIK